MAISNPSIPRTMMPIDNCGSSLTDRRSAASNLPPLGLNPIPNLGYRTAPLSLGTYNSLGQPMQTEQTPQSAMSMQSSLPNSSATQGFGMSPISAGVMSNTSQTSYQISPQSAQYQSHLSPLQYGQPGVTPGGSMLQPLNSGLAAYRSMPSQDFGRGLVSPSNGEGSSLPPPPPLNPAVHASQQEGLNTLASLPPMEARMAANSMMAPPLSAPLNPQTFRSPSLLGLGGTHQLNTSFSPRQPSTPYSAPSFTPSNHNQFSPSSLPNPASSPSNAGDIKFNPAIPTGTSSAPPMPHPIGVPGQPPPLTPSQGTQSTFHQYRLGNGNLQSIPQPVMTNLHMHVPNQPMSMIGGIGQNALGNTILPQGLPSAFANPTNGLNINMSSMHGGGPGMPGIGSMHYGGMGVRSLPATPSHTSNGTNVPSHRPFQCNECSQGFNRNHDLKRHKRIHLAVKPFPCKACPKSFSRKDALKRHILVKGCGKAVPPPLESRTNSDDSVETQASLQSKGTVDTAATSPGPEEHDSTEVKREKMAVAQQMQQQQADTITMDAASAVPAMTNQEVVTAALIMQADPSVSVADAAAASMMMEPGAMVAAAAMTAMPLPAGPAEMQPVGGAMMGGSMAVDVNGQIVGMPVPPAMMAGGAMGI